MKKKIVSIVVALSLLLPATVNAGFLSNLVAQFGYQVELTANETLELYNAMSQDMNAMADRILVMADKIDAMADKILEMADKIVATEQIMANVASDVAAIKISTSTGEVAGMYIDNLGQTDLFNSECPAFAMSDSPVEYLVYVSSTLTMNTNTISVLVHNRAELEVLWPTLITLTANGRIYIGVKSIANNKISSLSNILGYNVN